MSPQRPEPDVGTVLVTGAGGFIGSHLMRRINESGGRAIGVDLVADAAAGVRAGSTLAPHEWGDAWRNVDAVIHTAAIVSNAASRDDAWQVNVLGTSRVLAAARDAGARRFLHLSSVMVFGFDYPDGVTEAHPPRLTGYSYPDSRINSEAVVLAAQAAGDIQATIVRPGDVYGPGSVWVREPIRLIRSGQALLPAGGNGRFSPVYIDDLVDGIVLALQSETAIGQVITLSGARDVTCADYFGRLADVAGGRIRTLPTPLALRLAATLGAAERALGRDSELCAASVLMLARPGGYSIAKAARLLGYAPQIDLDTGMQRAALWARQEGLI